MTDTVFELRRYTLKPGARDTLIDVFDSHLVETQEAVGMSVVCQFRDPAAPYQFVWFRGFPDQEARTRALPAFYGGPVWAQHGPAANETMLEWHDVLMLKPAAPGSGFDTRGLRRLPPGTVDIEDGHPHLAAVHHLEPDATDDAAALVAKEIADAVRAIGGEVLASLISDRSENGFARLPVRESECVAVTLIRPAVPQAIPALEAALRDTAPGTGRAPDIARLFPTARSLLR
ncbi:NIPSNAP protein [Bosea sp. 62]|uniref:NIPSNAP family protein n=1 Tax=unclassified Bosea (in: a-proteobacteria) TaxID=2653178 RepID=UPI0012566052|nr:MULTISPECIES: NIPSNAP family protein [unclassified Bosea (in: a-proteobacteria)]CAD5263188.1 NIPSNAP protein [Bosea sp. 46]CAD5265505.1 NIPSNAP protein [Bosea sp. 21B]CAD5274255.1 NIPSNAP protein [Bosea sp. 7B]VVT56759.1 NIPSNAP protein [Bosea sp. EC-HK365B]VXB75879.1 NIPSNAP protein [Bosea sp. 29B]